MHNKSAMTLSLLFLMSTLIMSVPFTSINFSSVTAQEYGSFDYNDNMYSKYPTQENKYECRTGPFEGFFVGSVEFCKHLKFDDKDDNRKDNRDKDNRRGVQGPQGPQGPPGANGIQGPPGVNGTQGPPGVNGTQGPQGPTGVNGTNIDPCVACLLDALAKADSGAILVNVTVNLTDIIRPTEPLPLPPQERNITLPLVIDVDVTLLLQQQLAISLALDPNATIFEICAAIDEQGLDIQAVLTLLEDALGPIVTAQITLLVNQIAEAIEDITGDTIPPQLLAAIIAGVDIDIIVAQIIANVQVSLEILEVCLEQTRTTLTVTKTTQCDEEEFEEICPINPRINVTDTNPTPPNPTPPSFPASSTPIVVTLDPGQYNVTEQGFVAALPACSALGFDGGQQTALSNVFICTDFSPDCEGDISLGQDLFCDINNVVIDTTTPPTSATLTVNKTTSCDEEEFGDAGPLICRFDPRITVTDTNPTPPSFFASSTPINVTLGAGDYNVTEGGFISALEACSALGFDGGQPLPPPVPPGFGNIVICTNFSEDCSGNIGVGESLSCTIDNVVIDTTTPPTSATLTVNKTTSCDEEEFGDAGPLICRFDPRITVTDTNPTPPSFFASSTPINVTLGAGDYNVTEGGFISALEACSALGFDGGQPLPPPVPPGFGNIVICTNFSEDCSGNIGVGESLSCTIDNVVIDTTATLTVKKQVFGCDNIIPGQFGVMDCTGLQNNSSAPWLDCNTNANISNSIFCKSVPENIFDIEVLDDQNSQIQQFEGSEQGTTIPNLQPGTYTVNEIEQSELNFVNQLADDPSTNIICSNQEFPDGGLLVNTTAPLLYNICFEYEEELGNDCNTLTLAAGEERTCTVKNYIGAAGPVT
jgi:hypothetical protein